MDAKDDAGKPIKRLPALLTRGASSTALSSTFNAYGSLASPFELGTATLSAGDSEHASSINSQLETVSRDIAPFEAPICATLTNDLRSFLPNSATSSHEQQLELPRRAESLALALRHASVVIRYHAKWFAPTGLATLVWVGLEAAVSSSASVDLFAALALVDTIGTYSLLPTLCLLMTARFISYAYYQGSRANRLRRLTDEVWSVSVHLLQSHLGEQFMEAILRVIRTDMSELDPRTSFTYTVGAIALISDHLLSVKAYLPTVEMTTLITSLQTSTAESDDVLLDNMMDLLVRILSHTQLLHAIGHDGAWDMVMDIVERYVARASAENRTARALLIAMVRCVPHLELRLLPRLATLNVRTHQPLSAKLQNELLHDWLRVLPEAEWSLPFESLLKDLCGCSLYLSMLSQLVSRSLEIFLHSNDPVDQSSVIRKYMGLMIASTTDQSAAVAIGKQFVKTFRRSMDQGQIGESQILLFETLCQMADRSTDAATMLFRLRADVTCRPYFQAGPSGPAMNQSTSTTQVLYYASGLPIQRWLDVIKAVMQHGAKSWDVYNRYLVSLPLLIANHEMFEPRIEFVEKVLSTLCQSLKVGELVEPPKVSQLGRSHVVACYIQILASILSYHRQLGKQDVVILVSIFNDTAGSGDYVVSRQCIHALTICCYDVPDTMSRYMDDVIDKMSKMVTQRFLAIHVLQFLAGLSRLEELYKNFTQIDYKRIFGVCQSYLQSTRGLNIVTDRQATPTSERSSAANGEEALPEYVYALAHHVITFWYMAMKPQDRSGLKAYITSCLTYKVDGKDFVEDQGVVTIDMMDRVDAESMSPPEDSISYGVSQSHFAFDELNGRIVERHRLVGLLLISTETALRTGETVITTRRASGTSHQVLRPRTRFDRTPLTADASAVNAVPILPDDAEGRIYGNVEIPGPRSLLSSADVITLPTDDAVRRAMAAFDRTSALDSHKAGIIYIGENQTTEDRIFQNISGSPDYRDFIHSLGDLQALKGASFNPQGLDRQNDTDGEHTIVWYNNVTEVVFHITTMMPNLPDPRENTAKKKRHTGNDFVNIIFNNSGARLTYESLYNTFPSDFGYVYIVITPTARTSFLEARTQNKSTAKQDRFYTVQVLTKPDYPNVSPAAEEKVLSGASLPGFVRNLVLNDCIISLMKSPRSEPGEYPSSWRNRLMQLRRLGQRYGAKGAS